MKLELSTRDALTARDAACALLEAEATRAELLDRSEASLYGLRLAISFARAVGVTERSIRRWIRFGRTGRFAPAELTPTNDSPRTELN